MKIIHRDDDQAGERRESSKTHFYKILEKVDLVLRLICKAIFGMLHPSLS